MIEEFRRNFGAPKKWNGTRYSGSLYLRGTGITALPEGLTVGWSLDLENCTGITALPEGLTVGGDLDLRGTGITALPEGLTVGGYLDLRGTGITDAHVNRNLRAVFEWNFRGRRWIKADGIFQQVICQHGNIYKVRRIGSTHETWLVTDGADRWSHGDTIKEARADLIYKIANRDKSKYDGLALDSVLTIAEAIEAYRVITGACVAGTRNFVENILPIVSRKERYTIAEIIDLTRGNYGAETFKAFFLKKMNK